VLEHAPKKPIRLFDKDMRQLFEFERFLSGQTGKRSTTSIFRKR
jgi:hypothetical protein